MANYNKTKFLKLKSIKDVKDNKAIFTNLNNEEYTEFFVTLADSMYNQTFKNLFIDDITINEINGKNRLMSLINSLLYPDAEEDGEK
eukprot:jgi/Orpsp1_1/1192589/evm.model.d7180000094469.1